LRPHTPPSYTYTLSLHDALPILTPLSILAECAVRWVPSHTAAARVPGGLGAAGRCGRAYRLPTGARPRPTRVRLMAAPHQRPGRSEEHTSELQSRFDLVCRLLLE